MRSLINYTARYKKRKRLQVLSSIMQTKLGHAKGIAGQGQISSCMSWTAKQSKALNKTTGGGKGWSRNPEGVDEIKLIVVSSWKFKYRAQRDSERGYAQRLKSQCSVTRATNPKSTAEVSQDNNRTANTYEYWMNHMYKCLSSKTNHYLHSK
jgi:hypothetical protein